MRTIGVVKDIEINFTQKSKYSKENLRYKELGLSKKHTMFDSSGNFIYIGSMSILHNSVQILAYEYSYFYPSSPEKRFIETTSETYDEVHYI